jgi:TPR repeat protein
LAEMYFKGRGVQLDTVTAYMWVELAAAQGRSTATNIRDVIAQRMTLAQITKAQKMAIEWGGSAKHGPSTQPVTKAGD